MAYRLQRPADRARFVARYGPWAIVAGASEGIGAAFCDQLAAAGLNVVLIARREGPLRERAAQLEATHGVETRVVAADLGSDDIAERLAPHIADLEVGLLVYNACASTISEFMDASEASRPASLYVNCRGPLLLLPDLLAPMKQRGRGGVILMSSLSGFVGTAMVTTYAATKAFIQVLGEGLWEELGPHGVDVLVSAAGATSTPNFKQQTPDSRQASAFPMVPEDVARDALARLGAGPLTVPGRLNAAVGFVLRRVLGRRAAVRFMSSNTRGIYAE